MTITYLSLASFIWKSPTYAVNSYSLKDTFVASNLSKWLLYRFIFTIVFCFKICIYYYLCFYSMFHNIWTFCLFWLVGMDACFNKEDEAKVSVTNLCERIRMTSIQNIHKLTALTLASSLFHYGHTIMGHVRYTSEAFYNLIYLLYHVCCLWFVFNECFYECYC